MKRVIFVILISIFLNWYPTYFQNNDIAWNVYSVCKQFEVFLWVSIATSLIPYRYLFFKSIALVWAILAFFDGLPIFLWMLVGNSYYYPLYFVKSVVSLFWFLFIWFRKYDYENDKLNDSHFFIVGQRPNDFQNFFISMIKEPHGGVGIYAKGKYYHYRKGILKVEIDGEQYLKKAGYKYKIRKSRIIDIIRLNRLQGLLTNPRYKKWSWLKNCKTVLEPILSNRGKPLI